MGVLPPAAQAQPALPQGAVNEPVGAGPQAPLSETPEGGNVGYNGVVEAMGEKVSVKRGMAEFAGELYFVSDDGDFVVDKDHMVVGRVVNGVFVPIDDNYLAELQAKGMIEEGA